MLRVHLPILLNWSVLEKISSREFIRNKFHARIFLALFFDVVICAPIAHVHKKSGCLFGFNRE